MRGNDAIIIKVSPQDVQKGRTEQIRDTITGFTESHDSIVSAEGRIIFDLDELAVENQEPGENKDLRKFMQQLDREVPYLPFFLSNDREDGQIPLYTSLIVPFSITGDSLKFERMKLEKFAQEKIMAINDLCVLRGIDTKGCINYFCEQLNLEIIEDTPADEKAYPFKPEKITSESLKDFFSSGYYFHTIDATEEPVIFILVDNPETAYYADATFDIQLFESSHYPVIALEMSLFDQADNPLKMLFVYDINTQRHLTELHTYTEMRHILTYFLFRNEVGELMYGFARLIEFTEELREKIQSIIPRASSQLRAIPKAARNFGKAVEELYRARDAAESSSESTKAAKQTADKPKITPTQKELPFDGQESFNFGAAENEEKTSDPEEPFAELREYADIGESSETVVEEPEILQEIEILGESGIGGETEEEPPESAEAEEHLVSYSESGAFPTEALPAHIQKIARALSKPIRRPSKELTEEMTIKPAPTRVMMRGEEDQMERMSRRFVIMQNRLDQSERDNIRIKNEMNQLRDECERLERENLALKQRWWKFWK